MIILNEWGTIETIEKRDSGSGSGTIGVESAAVVDVSKEDGKNGKGAKSQQQPQINIDNTITTTMVSLDQNVAGPLKGKQTNNDKNDDDSNIILKEQRDTGKVRCYVWGWFLSLSCNKQRFQKDDHSTCFGMLLAISLIGVFSVAQASKSFTDISLIWYGSSISIVSELL